MEGGKEVDAAGASQVRPCRFYIFAILLLLVWCSALHAQSDLASSAKQLFDQERWPELAQLLQNAPRNSADLDFYYGVALAHQERWAEAGKALSAGRQLAPRDKRFPTELAGVAFKQKRFTEAKRDLQRALRLDPKDAYSNEFLATIYFLQGNLEAALKYRNHPGKPKVMQVRSEPAVRTKPALLDHAFALAPASTLTLDELQTSEARLRALEVFPGYKIDLAARPDGDFDAIFHAQERNGFGNNKFEALFRTFGGIIFQQVTPEYYNLHGSAINILSLFRWDPDKRRAFAAVSGPLSGNPKWRYRLGADLRNENWTVQTSFSGPSTVLGALNMRREAINAEIMRLVGARLSWTLGLEVSHRDFRNVLAGSALTPELLAEGYELKQKVR